MAYLSKHEHLVWLAISLVLFLFVLPTGESFGLRFVIGFIFYLFLKELFHPHFVKEELEEDRLDRLALKTSDRLHELAQQEKKEQVKDLDVRSYL
ncbi:MAG: hypothetical protein NTY66_03675 [Candidatus Vogelbacteria bacterium]|nr:hypothetical protein [Candidatus Vogelbacteria bacterium]